MSDNLENLLCGCVFLAAGAVILHNLDAVVRFDQASGVRSKVWFNEKLGKSVFNRELWSGGTKAGFRSSRIVFRTVAVFAILSSGLFIGLWFTRR
jgi:hypothetical protein